MPAERQDPYARRPRRKTREDRYERKLSKSKRRIEDDAKSRKRKKRKKQEHVHKDEHRPNVLDGFSAANVGRDRLTVS